MDHVVSKPTPPFEAHNGALRVHQIPVAKDNLAWIAECTVTGQAAVIDGPDAEAVLAYCAEHSIELTAVFNTHTHPDHIGVNKDLDKRGLLSAMRVVGSESTASAIPGLTEPVNEGDTVVLGAVKGRVMLTEGHIDGHISYVFGDVLFCGDTLFAGGCGYLFDGPPSTMFSSLMRLAALDGTTHVCCAHEYTEDNLRFAWSVEPDNEVLAQRIRDVWALRATGACTVPSTIATEQATNPFLRPGSPTLRAALGLGLDASFADVFAATRELKNKGAYKALADTTLPLEIAPVEDSK